MLLSVPLSTHEMPSFPRATTNASVACATIYETVAIEFARTYASGLDSRRVTMYG